MKESTDSASRKALVDPLWMAMSLSRRRKYKASISLCESIVEENGPDVAALYLKTRCLTNQSYIDPELMEEEGIADMLMDENAVAAVPRPGTSLTKSKPVDQSVRPVSSSGRPLTGFSRPSSSLPAGMRRMDTALKPGSSRPSTTLGRQVRMATASLQVAGNAIDTKRLNMQSIARRPPLALAIIDQLIYVDVDPRRALELGAECTKAAAYTDWLG